MKLTPSLLFTCFLISISSLLFSQSININTAKEIAKNHLLTVGRNNLKSASPNQAKIQFSALSVTSDSKDTLYFVLNDTINHSFVIVAADKRSIPIIGYSLEGNYDSNNQPPAFVAWMENRKQEIADIKKNNLQPDSAITAVWNNLSSANSIVETSAVEPLIQTQWDQGCYYNSLCPSDTQSPYCGHVPTGCTITAMAQIMKYWNYPTKGTGSHSYSHSTYGNLSADFGSTTYQWSQMPNSITRQNDAVATLMYHCGVSLDVDYGPNGSGAWVPRDALVQYFNYSSKAMQVNKSGFSTSGWINLLKSELDLQHPIWYTGSGGSGGHSFICDGYQDADYFHFNWGWSGSFDGYFYIGNLNPGGDGFNERQSAVINIVPKNLPDGYNGFFLSSNALYIATTGGSTSVDVCSSVNWTASSDQSWLSLSTNTGVPGKTTLTFTATENQAGSDRSSKVTISAVGFGSQTITVNQLTKVNVTPGNLYNLIANKASRITHLTLTGTIDARDFKTMRDAMPELTTVDMSEVTIVAYTGNEGPRDFEYKTYPANEIPDNAFYIESCWGKNYLEEFILPKTIKSIGLYSFYYCSYLTKINILASVINIGDHAFFSCNALIDVDKANPNYSSIDGVLFDKNQTSLIHCPTSKTGNYTIPSSVTSIKNFAFEFCGKLSSITIPSSVTFIEPAAFMDCNASIVVEENNLNFSGIDGVLFNKEQTTLIHCPGSKTGSYIIPSSVSSIGNSAFYGCYGLLTVTIPSSVTSIGDGAFGGCSGLTLVSIPSSVTSVGLNAFGGCFGLTTVTIPSSVTSIGEQAFCYCSGLTNVAIPLSVISIGNDAFFACTKLTNLTIPSSVKTIGTRAFASCDSLNSIFAYNLIPVDLNSSLDVFLGVNKNTCTLYVPYGSKVAYQSANQWKDFKNIVEVQNQAPTANAGIDQIAKEGKPVTLNGTSSTDVEGNSLTYKWTAPTGITLNKTTVSNPTFTAPDVVTNTNFTFSLVVNDGDLDSPADQVIVTVTPNQAPTANAGTDQTVNENSLCTLDGTSSSDPDNDELTYLWTAPTGITLNSKTVSKPTFTAPEVTTDNSYTFSLVVNDGSLNSTAYPIVVTVKQVNKAPTANAGTDQTVNENSLCTLDGSTSSDPDKDALTYLWSAPTGITLSSKTAQKPTFTAKEVTNDTNYTFSLIVSDGLLNSIADKVVITIKNVDKAPYVKNPIEDISVDKRAPDQIINLITVFADDDLKDVLSYSVTSNTNNQVVNTKIEGSNLTVSFSSQNTGSSEIVITANSNGKEVNSKFNVEVKIPTGIDPLTVDQKLEVYPNPTSGKVKIIFAKTPMSGTELTVTDITGKIVVKQTIQEKEEWIDLAGKTPGIYMLKINLGKTKVHKLILK